VKGEFNLLIGWTSSRAKRVLGTTSTWIKGGGNQNSRHKKKTLESKRPVPREWHNEGGAKNRRKDNKSPGIGKKNM